MNHIVLPSELGKNPTSLDFLVDGLLPANGVGVLFGETNVGKTAVAMDMAVHIAMGIEYHGRATRPTSVLYCLAEGLAGLPMRVAAICCHLGLEPASLDPHIGFRTVPTDFSIENMRDEVHAELSEKNLRMPGLCVLDTYSTNSSTGFAENDTAHAKRMGDAFRELARIWGAMVLVIHHSGWNKARLRGASDLLGTVDVSLKIERSGAAARTLTVEKARDFGRPEPLALSLVERHGGVVIDLGGESDNPFSPRHIRALQDLARISQQRPQRSNAWLAESDYAKSQFHQVRRLFVARGLVERMGDKYQLTDLGRGAVESYEQPTTPAGLRAASGAERAPTPVVTRSSQNGHRTAGSEEHGSSDRSSNGVRSRGGPEFGPCTDPMSWTDHELHQ